MAKDSGFDIVRRQDISELNTAAVLYAHRKTGARLLSLMNDDENKVFGVSFRTPPKDSTGVAHILEHSVLCGSRKYRVKEPFVELLKGSLQTFLNAFTYPDRTCYPVASQNEKDFYNLIDVYLDAVFYPLLTPRLLSQEGWRLEPEGPDGRFSFKGVVYSEMKGFYSSPERSMGQYAQEAVFPETTYRLDSGGAPTVIPDLTFEQFKSFHDAFYHPSNAFFYFYGDDDPDRRLAALNEYLRDFERAEIDSGIGLQSRFDSPRRVVWPVVVGEQETEDSKGLVTVNWLLTETADTDSNLALTVLEYILLGMSASPLRKALIDSGLGQDIVGVGLEDDLRQLYFSTGLKGIQPREADRVEALILQTMTELADNGIHPHTLEAAMNTVEFRLRENNTGQFPRGLALMLRSLSVWLYGGDPFAPLAFEAPLNRLKENLSSDSRFFEKLMRRHLIDNPHRVTVILEPDPNLAQKLEAEERERLNRIRESMSSAEIKAAVAEAEALKKAQETPDSPEALAAIPSLTLGDLSRDNKLIPLQEEQPDGVRWLRHDLSTNGVVYLDLGFNLQGLPQKYLPYLNLFGRSLLEMGTDTEDFVSFSQRIGRKTGGVRRSFYTSQTMGSRESTAWLFLRCKAMKDRATDLMDILRDALLRGRLDYRERFRQMTLEAIARYEERMLSSGHTIVNQRLRAHFSESGWVSEQIHGLNYLFFLRALLKRVDKDWESALADLTEMRRLLVNKNGVIMNLTYPEQDGPEVDPLIRQFQESLPAYDFEPQAWDRKTFDENEGLVVPTQVNYVGKGYNLYDAGYSFHGSALVITRHLRNSWLWRRIRVQGGAYGAFCMLDRMSGTIAFVSYRDPNLLETLDAFDQTADYLRETPLSEEELSKAIIGTIGDIDSYLLPDAKGFASMARTLARDTDESRRKMRDEVLHTTADHFLQFADTLRTLPDRGIVKVVGSKNALEQAAEKRPGWLTLANVL